MDKIKQTRLTGIDPLLGFAHGKLDNIKLFDNEEYHDHFIRISKTKDFKKRIVVIGGSTSDMFYEQSWVRKFYNLFNDDSLCIDNHAVAGYSSAQELFCLIRDIILTKPDLVISLSGINDLGFCQSDKNSPYTHLYSKKLFKFIFNRFGLLNTTKSYFNKIYSKTNLKLTGMNNDFGVEKLNFGLNTFIKDYEFWIHNQKLMFNSCKINNIKFLCFLQPIMNYGNYHINEEESKHLVEYNKFLNEKYYPQSYDDIVINFYSSIKNEIKKNNFIFDLSNIFSGKKNMYSDCRHPNHDGNLIIAEKIFSVIKSE